MIYFSKENINNTDCDIIMHECFCKKTDKDIINEYLFNKFDVAQKAHQEYIGPEIEKIKTRESTQEEEKTLKLEKKNNLFTNKEKFQKELEEKHWSLQNHSEKYLQHFLQSLAYFS